MINREQRLPLIGRAYRRFLVWLRKTGDASVLGASRARVLFHHCVSSGEEEEEKEDTEEGGGGRVFQGSPVTEDYDC